MTHINDGYAVTWVEEWRAWDAFEKHRNAPIFRRIVAVMELAASEPSVEIDGPLLVDDLSETYCRSDYSETNTTAVIAITMDRPIPTLAKSLVR
jgi:hypothetical protein